MDLPGVQHPAQLTETTGEDSLRKRFYIIFVAREEDGRLRKVPVPVHYAYAFVAAAAVGAFTLAGMAGSYSRMLLKTASFNQIRSQHEALRKDYQQLEAVTQQKEVQEASLGSLASEVTALYGLRQSRLAKSAATAVPVPVDSDSDFTDAAYTQSFDQLSSLRTTALSGRLSRAFESRIGPSGGTSWASLLNAPSLWPVVGTITSSFGEREDPFNGEGTFHSGIDIATSYGSSVRAAADGVVLKASFGNGYGREVEIDHGNGIQTVYGHLSGFAVTAGQQVKRGQVIGYVGTSGRSTGPHLHYEVRIRDTPVNPHKYLRETMNQLAATGGDTPPAGS
jgi:murein DD-endopeptidase MepM/ murein hydrolase activator NlpD